MDKKLLKYTPLTEATYYILLSLTKPLHGYGIIKKVEEITNGRLRIAPGTLYGVLTNLLRNELIKLHSIDLSGKKKKTYEVTSDGTKLLYYEITRLREMVDNGMREIDDYYE